MKINRKSGGFQTGRTYHSLSAIMTGVLFILFGSIMVSVPLSQLTRYVLTQQGQTSAEIELYFQRQFSHPEFVLIGLSLNSIVLFFAGWLTGKLSPHIPVWHGLVVAVLASLFFVLPTIDQVPNWYRLLLLTTTIGFCCVGAFFSKHARSGTAKN